MAMNARARSGDPSRDRERTPTGRVSSRDRRVPTKSALRQPGARSRSLSAHGAPIVVIDTDKTINIMDSPETISGSSVHASPDGNMQDILINKRETSVPVPKEPPNSHQPIRSEGKMPPREDMYPAQHVEVAPQLPFQTSVGGPNKEHRPPVPTATKRDKSINVDEMVVDVFRGSP